MMNQSNQQPNIIIQTDDQKERIPTAFKISSNQALHIENIINKLPYKFEKMGDKFFEARSQEPNYRQRNGVWRYEPTPRSIDLSTNLFEWVYRNLPPLVEGDEQWFTVNLK